MYLTCRIARHHVRAYQWRGSDRHEARRDARTAGVVPAGTPLPGMACRGHLSNMAMMSVLKRMDCGDITVDGMRSAIRPGSLS